MANTIDGSVIGTLFTIIVAAIAYVYGKGKREAIQIKDSEISQQRDVSHELRMAKLETQYTALKKEHDELNTEVNKIIQALERSYATFTYCHDNFPNKEMFALKMDSMQERLTGKMEAVQQIIELHFSAENPNKGHKK